MNRIIKFRGKIKDKKRAKELNLKAGDWVYGYYFHNEGLQFINGKLKEFSRHYIINTPCVEEWIEVIPETVGQFTGLYDKNGKEIYEEVGIDYQAVLIQPAILESIKQGMSQYTAEQLITKRSEVADVILDLLKGKLEEKGIAITALNITDLSFSKEFDKAVEDKQIVEQETQKAQYELEKAKVENEKKIENAKADAEVMKQQNKEITDEYLELKKLEVQQKIIEKWDGKLPTTTSETIPFLNIK